MRTASPVSRRRFLQSTAALTAGCTGLVKSRAGEGGSKVIVGGHPWVYAATRPDRDIYPILDQIFADMKYAGMDGIELMHTALRPADAAQRVAGLIEKHKLPVLGASFAGAMWDRKQHAAVLEDAELLITRLAKLGGTTLGASVGAAKGKKTPEQLDAQADLLRKIIALAKANGVMLNLHNHTYELADNQHDLKGTLARISDVKLGPDLNWLLRGGVDPVAFLREHRDRIAFLHLRDQTADGKWSEAMGEGSMDYAAVARTLHEIGFSGHAVIELAHERGFKPTRPLRESLKISRQFVRKVMGY